MISVIMPVYNVEEYIEKAISSVLNSTHKNLELIIINDCTVDNSMKIVKKFTDKRIKIIDLPVNQGPGMARRIGIENAAGDYIITVDADDWISESFLESLYKIAKSSNADIIGGGIHYWFSENNYKKFIIEPAESIGMQKFMDYNNGKIIFLNNKLVKRSLYDKVQYCGRRYVEDIPTVIPLMYHANKIAYVNDSGYYYRMRENSLTHTKDLFKESLFKALCAIDCIEFFKDKEAEYVNIIPLEQMLGYVRELKKLNLSPNDMKQYQDEYNELFSYILKLIQ